MKFAHITITLLLSQLSFLGHASEDLFTPNVTRSVVEFEPNSRIVRDADVRLFVVGPNNQTLEKIFLAGEAVVLMVNSGDQRLLDGAYDYELTVLNESGYRTSTPLDLEGKSSKSMRQSGTISLSAGRWLPPGQPEYSLYDQQFVDDVLVQGSICVGIDCVNNESFEFDTVRLKENNLRIRFVDTSNSASFPSTDWELRANDTTNGGANQFSIVDFDLNREIFSVEAGAPSGSLHVDNRGRVGFGTSTPLLDQHVVSGNTPASRFEQDGSGGFPSQIWDIGGNETAFFIRDNTNAAVPVRIQPGAPTGSWVVNSMGDIEIGGSIITNRRGGKPNKALSKAGQSQLMPLAEVADYIEANQHLPGMDKMNNDVLSLQRQLLEKVQELTLYTIQQEARIAALEKQLKQP